MYIVGSYEHGDGLASAALPSINRSAGESALAAAGWGLAYPDFIRSLPLGGVVGHLVGALLRRQFDTVDRGLALEAEWIDNWEAPPWKSAPTLREWVADAAAGTRPAAIFNATASESGQRFVIGTTTLARHPEVDGADTFTVQFAKSFAGFDLPIATAVRLSASFPWVSPMSRPQSGPEPLRVHVGDGAYYDNSGVVSATEWLLDARSALGRHPVTVLLIDAASDVPEPGTGWSWQRQLVAPLETLLSVRTSSQQFRAAYEQDVVAELLRDEERDVRAVFLAYPADRLAPLSWHLTADQRQRIERAWSDPDPTLRAATDTIRMRLGCAAR
jgi:hypothetical protein